MADKPKFDPTQPFEVVDDKPKFDPTQPFEAGPSPDVGLSDPTALASTASPEMQQSYAKGREESSALLKNALPIAGTIAADLALPEIVLPVQALMSASKVGRYGPAVLKAGASALRMLGIGTAAQEVTNAATEQPRMLKDLITDNPAPAEQPSALGYGGDMAKWDLIASAVNALPPSLRAGGQAGMATYGLMNALSKGGEAVDWTDPASLLTPQNLVTAATAASAAALHKGANNLSRGVESALLTADHPARARAGANLEARGAPLTAAQRTGKNPARLAQGYTESSMASSDIIQGSRERSVESATRWLDDAVQGLSPGRAPANEQVGRLGVEARQAAQEYHRTDVHRAYDAVDRSVAQNRASGRLTFEQLMAGARPGDILTQPIRQRAAARLKESRLIDDDQRRMLENIVGLPKTITFKEAQDARSTLLGARGTGLYPSRTQGTAREFAGHLDGLMEASARDAGGDTYELFRRANRLYRAGRQRFETNQVVARMADDNPSKFVDHILALKNDPTDMRAVVRTLRKGDRERSAAALGNNAAAPVDALPQVQRALMERILEQSTEAAGEGLTKGQNVVNRLRALGEPTMRELFGQAHAENILQAAEALSFAQEFTGKRAGGVSMRGMGDLAAGGVAAVAPGALATKVAAGAAALFTTRQLAKLLVDPAKTRRLVQALRLPTGTPQQTRLLSQLAAAGDEQGAGASPR